VRRDHRALAADRAARRSALIREALISGAAQPAEGRAAPTYEWLAAETGVPLGYLLWRFPVLDDLRRELDGGWATPRPA
jgi:DNA-binding transcriptional regulator YbjK